MQIISSSLAPLLAAIALGACVSLEEPPTNRSACNETPGWTWLHDVATDYCPDTPGGCAPATYNCFCAHPCKDDSDCAGTTLPRCSMVLLFNYSDGGSCSPAVRVCVAEITGLYGPQCELPPTGYCY